MQVTGFFAQVHGPPGVPCVLGEEDKVSLRLDPEDLGVFPHRVSKIWNMTQPADVLKLNESGYTWSGAPLNREMVRQIQEVVKIK